MRRVGCFAFLLWLVLYVATLPTKAANVSNTSVVVGITPGNRQVTAGGAITLTAKVSASGVPVTKGLVVFCKKDSLACRDAAVLGKAQLTSQGTAMIKLFLGVGSYQVLAVFHGTPHSEIPLAGSVSPVQTITVKSRNVSGSGKMHSVSQR
jgi:hypothetical protein